MFRFFFCLFLISFFIGAAQEAVVNNHIYDGNQLAKESMFDTAEMSYRKALSKAPEKPEALYNLGNTHYKEKNFEEAKQRYFQTQKFSENKSSKHHAFHNMGNVFMQQKDYAKAVESYKNALRNNPEDEQTRYNYALAKELLEKEQQEQEQNQDQKDQDDKDQEDKKDQDQDKEGEEEKDKEEDKEGKEGEDSEDKKEDGEEEKEEKPEESKDGKDEKEQQPPPKPKQGQLSPEQVKSLLEAMNNQEKKVQDKVNAEKIQGVPVRGEKDW